MAFGLSPCSFPKVPFGVSQTVCTAPKAVPRASLAGELVFKALEVGAATVATQAAVSSASSQRSSAAVASRSPERGLFRRRGRGRGRGQADDHATENAGTSSAAAGAEVIRVFIEDVLRPRKIEPEDGKSSRLMSKNEAAVSPASVEALAANAAAVLRTVSGAAREDRWVKLAVCVLIDLVGSGSLAVPFVGDVLDVATAPATALLLQGIFRNPMITAAGLAEELLPGTDGIPTATMAWIGENTGYLRVPNDDQVESGTQGSSTAGKRASTRRKGK